MAHICFTLGVETYLSPDEMRNDHVKDENTQPHDSSVDELEPCLLTFEQEVRLHDGDEHLEDEATN